MQGRMLLEPPSYRRVHEGIPYQLINFSCAEPLEVWVDKRRNLVSLNKDLISDQGVTCNCVSKGVTARRPVYSYELASDEAPSQTVRPQLHSFVPVASK
jgi:hypothetical protein